MPTTQPRRTTIVRLLILVALLLATLPQTGSAQPGTPETPNQAAGELSSSYVSSGAIISNGTLQLGVTQYGNLIVPGGTPASDSTTAVGLRYLPTNADALAPATQAEGWGVGGKPFAANVLTGFVNNDQNGPHNVTPVSFSSTGDTAISTVLVTRNDGTNLFRVTHAYHPSGFTPNLYQVDVTITNISNIPMDLFYRRVMDWDIFPTPFSEHITIQGTSGGNVIFSSSNGFLSAEPLVNESSPNEGSFIDLGPDDLGAAFDMSFGNLPPNLSQNFTLYYGATPNELDAQQALSNVDAEVYSLGQPNTDPTGGTPNTFIFGFANVYKDSDGDGLLDHWESQGLTFDPDSGGPLPAQFINLPALGADPNKPDIFVQLDWVPSTSSDYRLSPDAIRKVVEAFANSPHSSPTGSIGINLHVDHGPSSILNFSTGATWGTYSKASAVPGALGSDNFLGAGNVDFYNWQEFDAIKYRPGGFISTGRSPVFHYGVSASLLPDFSAGISRGIEASDFIITLGASLPNDPVDQSVLLMHELGHNLGLRHGGFENRNHKPNYLSVMNYLFSDPFNHSSGLTKNGVTRIVDYSHEALEPLNELYLDETVGLSDNAAGFSTRSYCPLPLGGTKPTLAEHPLASIRVDWNCDADRDDQGTFVDVNKDTWFNRLNSFEDWSHIVFKGGMVGQAGAQVPLPTVTKNEHGLDAEIFTASQTYATGEYPRALAPGDYNRDGRIDLAVPNWLRGKMGVLLNNGSGGFPAVTSTTLGGDPAHLVQGDFNGDSKPDLAAAFYATNRVSVRIGNGNGTFTTVQETSVTRPLALATGDLNSDGKADLVSVNDVDDRLYVLLNTGSGQFQVSAPYTVGDTPQRATLGDLNGDGHQDVVVVNQGSGSVSVLLGSATGALGAATSYQAGAGARGLALGDVNGDGLLDIVTANGGANTFSVLRGTGNGLFGPATEYAAGDGPNAVAIGMVNDDALADIVVANGVSDDVMIRLGDPSGRFREVYTYPVGDNPVDVVIRDFNNDGASDIATANFFSANISVLLNPVNPPEAQAIFGLTAAYGSGLGPRGLATGDINRDGIADLVVAYQESPQIQVLQGNSAGGFSAGTNYATSDDQSDVELADLNADGYMDAIVAYHGEGTIGTLLGTSSGGFAAPSTPVSVGTTPWALTSGDYNRDGKIDVAVANRGSASVGVMFGNGAGRFSGGSTFTVGTAPWEIISDDLNGDGVLDLAVANQGSNSVSVLFNNGYGGFGTPLTLAVGASPQGLAAGDFNRDGRRDLAVANGGSGTISLLLGSPLGQFAGAVSYVADNTPQSVTVGDLNADGKPDLIALNWYSNKVSVLFGNGNGTLQLAINYQVNGWQLNAPVLNDFNRDGKLDLALANFSGGNVIVLQGKGGPPFDGALQPAISSSGCTTGLGMTSGDTNHDGITDLVKVCRDTNNIKVVRGTGSGTFQNGTTHTGYTVPVDAELVDIDSNGKLDLVTANSGNRSVGIAFGQGNGTFAAPTSVTLTSTSPWAVTSGDFNRDGRRDIAVVGQGSNAVEIVTVNPLANNFVTSGYYAVGTTPWDIQSGDFNRDGKLDLVVANEGSGSVSVLLNNGSGGFPSISSFQAGATPRALATGDLNRDGKLDLVVANHSTNRLSVLLGNGSGGFSLLNSFLVESSPSSVAIGDIDSDGKLDVVATNWYSNKVSVLRGNGDGTLQFATQYTTGGWQLNSAVLGDFNRDGKLDVAVADFNGGTIITLLN